MKFALQSVKPDTVKRSFMETGVFPLNRDAIDAQLLVGDQPASTRQAQGMENQTRVTKYADVQQPAFLMTVYDDDAEEECQASTVRAASQTDPVASLPCSSCLTKDVSLHPMVKMGMVDLELAEALYDSTTTKENKDGESGSKGKTTRRDYSKGRWLTEESEVNRRREETEKIANEKAEKEKRVQEAARVKAKRERENLEKTENRKKEMLCKKQKKRRSLG